jgi:hypothetical protein
VTCSLSCSCGWSFDHRASCNRQRDRARRHPAGAHAGAVGGYADSAAVLTLGSRRRTHFAQLRFASFKQAPASQLLKRASAPTPALRSSPPQKSPLPGAAWRSGTVRVLRERRQYSRWASQRTMSAELQMRSLRRLVRPVIFETGCSDFPLSTAGTAFLLSSGSDTFVITAKHVVGAYPPDRLRVYQSDQSETPLPVKDFYRVNAGEPGGEIEDLLVLEIETAPREEQDAEVSIRIEPMADAWHEFKDTAKYFLIGYPEPKSFVDFEGSVIHSGQVLIAGRYISPSVSSPYCHDLRVDNPLSISNFSGFSGAPVFSLHDRVAMPSVLVFCGLALQGTATSGLIRFLDCTVIQAAMDEIHLPALLRRAHPDT